MPVGNIVTYNGSDLSGAADGNLHSCMGSGGHHHTLGRRAGRHGGPSCPCRNSRPPAWLATAVYTAGMAATLNGAVYQANWWTQGNNPQTSSGPSGSGQPWTLVPPANAVPTTPTGLTVTAVTPTTTTLQWQPSTAPDQPVTGYAVYENGVQIATAPTNSYTVANLTAATTYAFAIAALDSAGSSPESTVLSVTTTTHRRRRWRRNARRGAGGSPVPLWNPTAVYTSGMIVTINGSTYQANWWTQGNDPTANSGSGSPGP